MFLKVLKRLVAGEPVTFLDIKKSIGGSTVDHKNLPAFLFWATVGTPQFDLFVEFWKYYLDEYNIRPNISSVVIANPKCYHFYGQKKKFNFPKAISDIVAFIGVSENQMAKFIVPSFIGVFIKYAKPDDWRLFDEYKQQIFIALYGQEQGEIYSRQPIPRPLNFYFTWLGNPVQLERLVTADGPGETTARNLVGRVGGPVETNVHAPPEFTKFLMKYITTPSAALTIEKVVRNLPSNLEVFDPRTGGTRKVESLTKLFDFYLECMDVPDLKPYTKFVKTEMINTLAKFGFTADYLQWVTLSYPEIPIDNKTLRLSSTDYQLLIADPKIVITPVDNDAKAKLAMWRKENKKKVDATVAVLVEKGVERDIINNIIQAAMPWKLVWVGLPDAINRGVRQTEPKSTELARYINTKVYQLEGKRDGVARSNMILVDRKLSDKQTKIVNNLKPFFSDHFIVEDEEADRLLRLESIIMAYMDNIDDAVFDGLDLLPYFSQKIKQAKLRQGSLNAKLLETAIHRIMKSEKATWTKDYKNTGMPVKDVVQEVYWKVRNSII